MADMPAGMPTRGHFDGSLLQVSSVDWAHDRAPNTGGADVGSDHRAPDGRVIVEWDARETSCIRCESGRDVRLVTEQRGVLDVPVAVHVGVRFREELNPAGSGASYTGTITMVTVPFAEWKVKAVELIG